MNYLLLEEGRVLAELATVKSGTESKHLLEEALKKFESSVRIKPDDYRSIYNIGSIWCCLAGFYKDDTVVERFYKNACKQFEFAAKIVREGSDYQEILWRWKQAQLLLSDFKQSTHHKYHARYNNLKHIYLSNFNADLLTYP